MGTEFGYVRVSSQDQNEARQLATMREHGIPKERLFIDKASGRNFQRPQYQALVRRLQPGDCLCVR